MKLQYLFTFIISFFYSILFAQFTEMAPIPERVTNNAVVEGYQNGVPYVYSFAGLDSTKHYNGIHLRSFRYNVQTDIWETIPPLPDTLGKIAASASRIGDIIYIIGGYHVFQNGSEVSSDKVHRFNTQTNSYLSDGAPIPVPIDDQVQVVWRDSLIFVITGWSNTENVPNVQIYNPTTDEWVQGTATPTNSDYPSFGAAGVIFNDTIFFFGGARNGDFDAQRKMKKGIINPENPTEISWSAFILDWGLRAYRPAAFSRWGSELFWIGGSDVTYNYDGIAYSNGQGVEPNNRVIWYNSEFNMYQAITNIGEIPMDLRGVAVLNDSIQFLVGGMESGQMVSNKTIRIDYIPLLVNASNIEKQFGEISIYPNPANQKLNIQFDNTENCKDAILKIYDAKGIEVKSLLLESCSVETDINDLPSGVYQVVLSKNSNVITKQFVKH